MIVLEHLDHLPFLFEGRLKSCEAFFAASSSIVSRPTICSSSASRAWSAVASRSCAKARLALASSCFFQEVSSCSPSWFSRQTWAAVFVPVRTWRTTRALNSGLKVRRFAICGFPFLDCMLLIENCPVFGVHYKHLVLAGHTSLYRKQSCAIRAGVPCRWNFWRMYSCRFHNENRACG